MTAREQINVRSPVFKMCDGKRVMWNIFSTSPMPKVKPDEYITSYFWRCAVCKTMTDDREKICQQCGAEL